MSSNKSNSSISNQHSWKCFLPDSSSGGYDNVHGADIPKLIDQIQQFPTTLKDDKRSLVKQGEILGKTVIAKQLRDKNRRKWIRFLSLFRRSEALRLQKTLVEFKQFDIASVKPFCALENRQHGMVIDSWLVYEFREGEPADVSRLNDIIQLLQKLHTSGFRHDDPNFCNFLIDENNEVFLIDCQGKRRIGLSSDYYDFMLLHGLNKDVQLDNLIELANIDINHWAYKIAIFYSKLKRKRSEIKKKLRQTKKR